MSDRHHDAARGELTNRIERARQLRCECHELQMLQRHYALECFSARLEAEPGMRAESHRRDERPLEMHSQNARARRVIILSMRDCLFDSAMYLLDAIERRGYRGGQPCADAFAR